MWELDHKESWTLMNQCFWTVVFGKTFKSLKGNQYLYSLEGLMLKLKLQYFGHLRKRTDSWEKIWCWERLKAGGEGDNKGWDGWMASLTWWTWVWASSRSWWWTGKPGMLQSMGSQKVRHDWVTELNWLIDNIHQRQKNDYFQIFKITKKTDRINSQFYDI